MLNPEDPQQTLVTYPQSETRNEKDYVAEELPTPAQDPEEYIKSLEDDLRHISMSPLLHQCMPYFCFSLISRNLT
jgi:hypothetical protein